jgi:hypothetical protein
MMQPEGLSPCPEPVEFSPHIHTVSVISILLLSPPHLRLGIPVSLFPQDFPTKMYSFFIYPVRTNVRRSQ